MKKKICTQRSLEKNNLPVEDYSYNVKWCRGECVDWQCTIRRKDNICPATVTQKPGLLFVRGKNDHSQAPAVGSATVAKICTRVKEEAISNLFCPAPYIVNRVLSSDLTNEPCQSLPKVENICSVQLQIDFAKN